MQEPLVTNKDVTLTFCWWGSIRNEWGYATHLVAKIDGIIYEFTLLPSFISEKQYPLFYTINSSLDVSNSENASSKQEAKENFITLTIGHEDLKRIKLEVRYSNRESKQGYPVKISVPDNLPGEFYKIVINNTAGQHVSEFKCIESDRIDPNDPHHYLKNYMLEYCCQLSLPIISRSRVTWEDYYKLLGIQVIDSVKNIQVDVVRHIRANMVEFLNNLTLDALQDFFFFRIALNNFELTADKMQSMANEYFLKLYEKKHFYELAKNVFGTFHPERVKPHVEFDLMFLSKSIDNHISMHFAEVDKWQILGLARQASKLLPFCRETFSTLFVNTWQDITMTKNQVRRLIEDMCFDLFLHFNYEDIEAAAEQFNQNIDQVSFSHFIITTLNRDESGADVFIQKHLRNILPEIPESVIRRMAKNILEKLSVPDQSSVQDNPNAPRFR